MQSIYLSDNNQGRCLQSQTKSAACKADAQTSMADHKVKQLISCIGLLLLMRDMACPDNASEACITKKFYYIFTPKGTLKIALAGYNKKPEFLAQIEPAFTQTCDLHTQGCGMVPMLPNRINTCEMPAIIECLLYYQQYYNLN